MFTVVKVLGKVINFKKIIHSNLIYKQNSVFPFLIIFEKSVQEGRSIYLNKKINSDMKFLCDLICKYCQMVNSILQDGKDIDIQYKAYVPFDNSFITVFFFNLITV